MIFNQFIGQFRHQFAFHLTDDGGGDKVYPEFCAGTSQRSEGRNDTYRKHIADACDACKVRRAMKIQSARDRALCFVLVKS